MPQRREVRWSQLKVGLVSIVSLTLLAATIFLITGQTGLFTQTVMLHTYSSDAGGLKTGAVVRLAGVDVGNISRVGLSGRPDLNEAVDITFEVNSRFMSDIRTDSRVMLAAEGLLGERYINITKGVATAADGTPLTIPAGGTVPFRQTAEFSELVGGSRDLLDNLNVLTSRLNSIVETIETGQGTVGKFIKDDTLFRRLDATVSQAETLVADLNSGKGSLGRLLKSEDFYTKVNATVDKLQSVTEKIDSGDGTVARLINDPSLYRNAEQLMSRGSTMIDNINQGQGTLGKLATDDEFYRKLNSAVGNVEALSSSIRSGEGTIGRLFHDPSLYDGLNATSLEVRELMGDFRKDPKKFLTIQLKIF
ncbi:MAG: MCE family protein [Acidobacteria bacterium]|nr:MCE family protein [Acidobacteriota bacterium]